MKKYIVERRFSQGAKQKGKDRLSTLLAYAGIPDDPNVWLGSKIMIVVLFGIVGTLLPITIFQFFDLSDFGLPPGSSSATKILISIGAGLLFAGGISLLLYMHLYYMIRERAQRVESVLPDFLSMVAANMRSGMTPISAFQAATRPEFGPLQSEIAYVSSISLGSDSFAETLKELTKNIDSGMLRRVVIFFENGLRSGGKMAELLETSAEEIREMEDLRRHMIINTQAYVIFVVFILMFGLPLLLAISSQFLTIFSKVQEKIGPGGGAGSAVAGMPQPKMNLDVKFINNLSYLILIGCSVFTSILVGVISEGKFLYGLKYSIPLLLGAGFFFTIFKMVIGSFLGSLM